MLLSLKMEYQLPRQGMKAASKLERQLNGFSPGTSRRSASPATTLIFTQWNLFQTADLQSCKTLHSFRPLNTWWLVLAATDNYVSIYQSCCEDWKYSFHYGTFIIRRGYFLKMICEVTYLHINCLYKPKILLSTVHIFKNPEVENLFLCIQFPICRVDLLAHMSP